eukprot:PRCOL_00005254-RA
MTVAPRAAVTRALMTPLWFPIACAGVHFWVDAIGFGQPNATEELAKFAGVFSAEGALRNVPLESFQSMLENPNFVTEEWAHVLAWDLFVGRWVWLDAVRRDVPLVRASVLLTNFTGPPGLLLHLTMCMLSGKGLPPPEWDGGQGAEGSGGSSALPFVLPAAPDVSRADERIRRTFCSDGGGEWCDCIECGAWDAGRVAAACAPDVVWEDMSLEEPLRGSQAVYAHLAAAQAEDERNGATIAIERIADGERASGFTFHRAREGVSGRGLRGTLYLEVDDQGRIQYVRVGVEPLFKPGEATAKLLKAIAEKQAGDGGTADARPAGALERRTPTACSDVVRYLWCDVQGSGASVVDESVRFFSDGVRYEDFNYEQPFLGKAAVEAFLREFDIPGLTFVVERVSDGESACAFCWEVDLGMGEGARRVKGISFYELDQDGKIAYVRDIPEPAIKPPPMPAIYAALGKLDPALKVVIPSPYEPAVKLEGLKR